MENPQEKDAPSIDPTTLAIAHLNHQLLGKDVVVIDGQTGQEIKEPLATPETPPTE